MAYEFLLFFALCSTAQVPAVTGRSLDVAGVLERWDAGSKLIESYDLSLELETRSFTVKENGVYRLTVPGESYPAQLLRSHVVKKGEKRFGEFGGDGKGRFGMTLCIDGEFVTSSMVGQNEFALQKGVTVFGSNQYEDYDASYRMILGTMDRIAASKERGARLLSRDGSAYVIAVPEAKEGNLPNFTWKVWLDSTKNFMPIRLMQSLTKAGREIRDLDCTYDLKEVSDGVWAPVEATISVYNKDEKMTIFGKIASTNILKVVQEHSRFNVPIADEVFASQIPVGATVVDRMRNVVYTKGSSDPEGYLADLATKGKQQVQGLSPADRGPPTLNFVPDLPNSWFTGRMVLAVVVALVAVVAVTIGLRRVSGRRS